MELDAKTKVFAVIGDPIGHSLSPVMHNRAFEDMGINAVYTAFNVKAEELGDAIKGFRALGFGGVNVTIPHKVNVMDYVDKLSDEARIIGAVNTIEFGDKIIGHNTDGMGALRALKDAGADPRGKKVLLLGSGGAARAIAVTLALRGDISYLTILGVIQEEVEKLAGDVTKNTQLDVVGALLNENTLGNEIGNVDFIIHATPVGMHPKTDESLVSRDLFRKGQVVMDIVYNPRETKLIKEAKKAGCVSVEGLEMFVNQGVEAEKIWLGVEAPSRLMKDVVIKKLG